MRLKGEGNNAGVQFRSERVPNHHEVSGYQCDVGGAFDRSVGVRSMTSRAAQQDVG